MARPTIKPAAKLTAPKRKQGQLANSSNKWTKKSCIWFLSCFWPFYKLQVIHALKTFSLKIIWHPNWPTYRNFYYRNFNLSSSNLNLLRSTFLNYSLTHKASVFLLSTPTGLGGFLSTTFLSDSNNLLVFPLSFSTGLGSFSSIDSSGFPP